MPTKLWQPTVSCKNARNEKKYLRYNCLEPFGKYFVNIALQLSRKRILTCDWSNERENNSPLQTCRQADLEVRLWRQPLSPRFPCSAKVISRVLIN